MDEPPESFQAKKLIRTILESGTYVFSDHALKEMTKDDLQRTDAINVLRGGFVEPAEWERGSWRYRVRTNKIYVVVTFRSKSELVW